MAGAGGWGGFVGVPVLACRWVGRVYMDAGFVAQILGEPAPTRHIHM